MKNHIYKIRFIIITITIIATIVFFAVVSHENNSDNASLRQLALRAQYQWYSLMHKKDLILLPSTSSTAQGIPVLVYHGITKLSDRFNMTQSQFTEQMFALKKAGYQTITPDEFTNFLKNHQPLPEKSFLLTFDDGRKDSYYGADPVLKFLDFKAVMLIATHQSLDKGRLDYYLSPDELSYMIKTGRWFIESHAKQNDGGYVVINKDGETGNFLSNLKWLNDKNRLETIDEYKQRIVDELSGSKKQIEDTFGVKVELFSYPFGDYGIQSKNFKGSISIIHDIVSQTYPAAFHQIWPVDYSYLYNKQTEDTSLLKRLEPSPILSGVDLVATLDNGNPKQLPFADTFSSDLGWKHSWGETTIDIKNKTLILSGGAADSGAFTYIDGSSVWKNYFANIHVNATHNSDISIAARFFDEENYTDCFFSNGTVQIRNKHNGVTKKVIESKNNYVFTMDDVFMGVAVYGNKVACFLNNHEVLRTTISSNNISVDGGFGVGMWSSEKNSSVSFYSLSVVKINDLSDSIVKGLQKLPLAVLAGEVTYTESVDLPKEYPHYSANIISKTFSNLNNYDFTVTPVSDNLVKNNLFSDIENGIPVGWHKNIYGNTVANLNFVQNSELVTEVNAVDSEGQAGWYFDPIPVTPSEEYVVSGLYTSNAPVLFVVEYKMDNETYQQDRMSWLVPTSSPVLVRGVVRAPFGAEEMTAYFMLENNGIVSIKDVSVKKLPNGEFTQGMLTLNFDDGFATSYTDVFPLLKKLGLTATHYIVSDYVGYSRYMTKEQITDLQNAGEEIGAHTTKHPRLTLLSEEDLVHEIVTPKKELEAMGFSVATFDYPYGSVNNFVRAEVIKAGYLGARSTLRGFNTKNTDPFMLRDQHIDKDTTFAEIKNYIDQAIAGKIWLVLEFHDTVSNEKGLGEAIRPELLAEMLAYVKDTHIKVVTMKQGLTLMK